MYLVAEASIALVLIGRSAALAGSLTFPGHHAIVWHAWRSLLSLMLKKQSS